MKTIGLVGGMSWASSLEYYRIINEGINEKLGGLHSGKILLNSIDFEELEHLQSDGRWTEATDLIVKAARILEFAGADFVLICSNTGHQGAEKVMANINIPLLHIVDATAEQIMFMKIKKVGLLGTKFTLEQDFYKSRLANKFGIEVITPNKKDSGIINDIIYKELCFGKVKRSSKEQFLRIIGNLIQKGACGIVLGCTEITLLIKRHDRSVPIFDSTKIHAKAAIDFALEG